MVRFTHSSMKEVRECGHPWISLMEIIRRSFLDSCYFSDTIKKKIINLEWGDKKVGVSRTRCVKNLRSGQVDLARKIEQMTVLSTGSSLCKTVPIMASAHSLFLPFFICWSSRAESMSIKDVAWDFPGLFNRGREGQSIENVWWTMEPKESKEDRKAWWWWLVMIDYEKSWLQR